MNGTGKITKRKPKGQTFTLKGAQAHKFLRALDPTFPLHPDEKAAPPPTGLRQDAQTQEGGR